MKDAYKNNALKLIAIFTIIALIFSCVVVIEPADAASKTHLKKTTISVTYGSSYQQKLISSSGKTISAKSVKWVSKDKSIAKISSKGKITAVKAGTVKMTAKYKKKTYKFTVKVNPKLRTTKKTLKSGSTYTQKLYYSKGKAYKTSKLKFSTNNSKVATVSSKGVIKAKKPGTATISVKYKGKTYKSTITVKGKITLDKANVTFTGISESKKVKIKVDSSVDEIWYDIENEDITSCKWGKWDGNTTYLTITPNGYGNTKIKIYHKGKGSSYDYKYINVSVEPAFKIKCNQSLPLILFSRYNIGVVESFNFYANEYGMVYMNVAGKVTDNTQNNDEWSFDFRYRITDSNGYVVEDSYVYTDAIFQNEKFKEEKYIPDIEADSKETYTIEFLNY